MQLNEQVGQKLENARIPTVEIDVSDHSEATDRATQMADANKRLLHFLLGAQRMMLEEVAFAACITLDRVRSETHLFGEFAANLAKAHSARDLNMMALECGKHQFEFVRRECDRMLRHGERLIEATSGLLDDGRNADAAWAESSATVEPRRSSCPAADRAGSA
jgi:hypothetical protein